MVMKRVNWKNDPLLHSEECRYLINGRYVNIYKALVWEDDFKDNHWMQRTPFCIGKKLKEEIHRLCLRSNLDWDQFLKLLSQNLQYYTQKSITDKYKFKSRLHKQIEKSSINMVVLREISILTANRLQKSDGEVFQNLIKNIKYYTDYQHRSKFKIPLDIKKIVNNLTCYIVGVIVGDGSAFSGPGLAITDGHYKKNLLKYSKIYLDRLAKLINDFHGIYVSINKIHSNAYQLKIPSKWFTRFYASFFDIPLGYKYKKIRTPNVLNFFPEKERLQKLTFFWRGLFDTDGEFSPGNLTIGLASKNKQIIKSFKGFTNSLGMATSRILPRKNGNHRVLVLSEGVYKFAQIVGCSHPRKALILSQHLRRGPRRSIFKGIRSERLYNGYYDLTLIADQVRVTNMGKMFKQLRIKFSKKNGRKIHQDEFGGILGLSKDTIGNYERDECAIPLSIIFKVGELCDYSREDVYIWLENARSKFVPAKGRADIKLNLFIKPDPENEKRIKCLRPLSRRRVLVSKSGGKSLKNDVENLYGLKVYKEKNAYFVNNFVLQKFLNTFFIYDLPWKPLNEKEVTKLQKGWFSFGNNLIFE